MSLNKYQQTKCLEILDKMISWPMCSPFVNPVDPEKDGMPDYFQVIKNPLSLTDVKRKLQSNEYSNVSDWQNDVNQIFQNAKDYNGDDTIFSHMAMEASNWFNRKVSHFPTTAEEEWIGVLQRSSEHLLDILSHPPPELDPSGKLTVSTEEPEEEKPKVDPPPLAI